MRTGGSRPQSNLPMSDLTLIREEGKPALPPTYELYANEMVWFYREFSKVGRRFEEWEVIRSDKRHVYMKDIGPAEDFPTSAFEIPAFMEHSVAELRDLALSVRSRHQEGFQEMKEITENPTDIAGEYVDQLEKNQKIVRNASHFGPTHSQQRNRTDI